MIEITISKISFGTMMKANQVDQGFLTGVVDRNLKLCNSLDVRLKEVLYRLLVPGYINFFCFGPSQIVKIYPSVPFVKQLNASKHILLKIYLYISTII